MWNSNDFLTWILYKFRITFWMILYNLTLLIYFSLQFLKLDFISLQTQFLYNFWKLFSLSLQFLKLAFISLQFLKLTFISLQFLFLYDSDATHFFTCMYIMKLRLQFRNDFIPLWTNYCILFKACSTLRSIYGKNLLCNNLVLPRKYSAFSFIAAIILSER